MIVPRYYEDLSVLHENTMPARAYFIPAFPQAERIFPERVPKDKKQVLKSTIS